MPRSELPIEGSHPDLANILEQHLRAGFQPDLALDLVLNELVIRAAEATHASSAALALARGDELVCRAATGNFAPDLGVPLNPREGLSGVCLRTREPQLSVDTEVDPRVAVAFSRRFGIRSVLAVPVFEKQNNDRLNGACTGVLEVFSATPAAFSRADQRTLEAFAEECARVRYTAANSNRAKPAMARITLEPQKADVATIQIGLPFVGPVAAPPMIVAPIAASTVVSPAASVPMASSPAATAPKMSPMPVAPAVVEPSIVKPSVEWPVALPVKSAAELDAIEIPTTQVASSKGLVPTTQITPAVVSKVEPPKVELPKVEPQAVAASKAIAAKAVTPELIVPKAATPEIKIREALSPEVEEDDAVATDGRNKIPAPVFTPHNPKADADVDVRREAIAAEVMPREFAPMQFAALGVQPTRRSPYEAWTLVLGGLAILAITGVSFLIGSRIGWLRATEPAVQASRPAAAYPARVPTPTTASKAGVAETISLETGETGQTGSPAARSPRSKPRTESKAAAPAKSAAQASPSDELVIYEKGKVVYRLKNQPSGADPQSQGTPAKANMDSNAETASTATAMTSAAKIPAAPAAAPRSIWLNPAEAALRLVNRIEPEYPSAARTGHRAGQVVLEVDVAEDGSVASVRTLKGDPLLAAAATQAVRNWRYQPYLRNDHPSQFHTDVTLSFAVSN